MKYQLAIFDFDGTLADSFPFFVSVFNELAGRHRFRPISAHEVEALRGYDARQLMRHLGLSKWRFPFVARDFIALMNKHGGAVQSFAGTRDMLSGLAAQGVRLAIVSSNSAANVTRVLGPSIMPLFEAIECGASVFGKAARLKRVLKKCGIDAKDAIYIGDQPTDIEAARAANMAFGAVAWGYGSRESLRAYSPEEEFSSLEDINRIARLQAV